MDHRQLHESLPAIVDTLVKSVMGEPRMQHLNRVDLPNRDVVIEIIKKLRQLVYPGYFGKQGLTSENVTYRIGELVMELAELLYDQIRCCMRYGEQIPEGNGHSEICEECNRAAAKITHAFFERMPAVRELLAGDVQAAFDSDPAAKGTDETIFCYPGLFAGFVQRFAHVLHEMNVPLLPRIMTEYAHSLTGIDIHPGARLGQRLFVDHGTGVVIGETTVIGNNVKIYQGVTLGAVAPEFGQLLRGQKRHPTIEDDVVLYAGATILGGETVIGKASVIGGNVFLTASVPAGTRVTNEPSKLRYKQRKGRGRATESLIDFEI